MKEVFIEKSDRGTPGLTVGVILGSKAVKGEVGIEIEVEGKKLPHEDTTPPPWLYHHDGSLRGEDNAEYVLKAPIPFDGVEKALSGLWKVFKTKKSVLDDSNRTSVHIHLNCQNFHLNRLTAFLGIYFALEEILTDWCGEHRVGNLFCLRAIDAPAIVTWSKKFIQSDGQAGLPESLHYAGLNISALKKFGSIEVRTLRGVSDPGIILRWIEFLRMIYEKSADFPDPREICTIISSGGGPVAFFDMMLGAGASLIRSDLGLTDSAIRERIMTGIRLSQDVCYCRDWSLYNPMELKPDPFNRSLKKVAKKMMGGEPLGAVVSYAPDWASLQPEPEYDPDPEDSY